MATERRLIDANALKWKLGQVTLYVPWLRFGKNAISKILESYRRAVFKEIDNAPTVDAVEVVHGRWCFMGLWEECSICRYAITVDGERTNYCPNCGAKMDRKEN